MSKGEARPLRPQGSSTTAHLDGNVELKSGKHFLPTDNNLGNPDSLSLPKCTTGRQSSRRQSYPEKDPFREKRPVSARNCDCIRTIPLNLVYCAHLHHQRGELSICRSSKHLKINSMPEWKGSPLGSFLSRVLIRLLHGTFSTPRKQFINRGQYQKSEGR